MLAKFARLKFQVREHGQHGVGQVQHYLLTPWLLAANGDQTVSNT